MNFFFSLYLDDVRLSSVHDGVFRQYDGGRSLKNLEKYINNEQWKETKPVASHFAPNSLLYVAHIFLFQSLDYFSISKDVIDKFIIWFIKYSQS